MSGMKMTWRQQKEANENAVERNENLQTPKRTEKIPTGFGWYSWKEKLKNYWNSIPGVGGVTLTYILPNQHN